MPASQHYVLETAFHTQRALEKMPIRSSAMARQMVKAHLPEPETSADIERYVRELLTPEEQRMCDMATD